MVEFYLLTFPRFPLRKKKHKPYFGKNRTHDFRTSRCADYLLDYSGEVDCIKRTTAALSVWVETIEPDHHLLNHRVMSFVAQVGRAASVGSRAGIAVGNPAVVRLPASSRSTGRKQVGSHERFSEAGSRAHAETGDG